MTADKRITIDPQKCKLSGECMKTCPEKAIDVKDEKETNRMRAI